MGSFWGRKVVIPLFVIPKQISPWNIVCSDMMSSENFRMNFETLWISQKKTITYSLGTWALLNQKKMWLSCAFGEKDGSVGARKKGPVVKSNHETKKKGVSQAKTCFPARRARQKNRAFRLRVRCRQASIILRMDRKCLWVFERSVLREMSEGNFLR